MQSGLSVFASAVARWIGAGPGAVLARLRACALKSRALPLLIALCGVLSARATLAQLPPLPLGATGLTGGRYVGNALPVPSGLLLMSSLGYGYTEDVLHQNDHHHRVAGELYGAFARVPWFQISAGGEVRLDQHAPDGPGPETMWIGDGRITTRHAFAVHHSTGLALQPAWLLPGASTLRRGLRASSFEITGLATQRFGADVALSLMLGYRIDRSRHAVPDANDLVPAEKLSAALSEHDAYLLGTSLALPIARFRLSFEWSWDLQRGGALRPAQSPMRARAALQAALTDRLLPGVELGVDTSARPELEGLLRIEPRLWARVSLGVRLDRASPPKPAPRAAPTPAPAPAPEALEEFAIQVLNLEGEAIAGARIRLLDEPSPRADLSDASGWTRLSLPRGSVALAIEADGYEARTLTVRSGADRVEHVTLTPALPAAEIKGVVRNLAGEALAASIDIQPLAITLPTDAQGQFAVEVAPGEYTLKISADGYETQQRFAKVEQRGVTIVVVDMKRARP